MQGLDISQAIPALTERGERLRTKGSGMGSRTPDSERRLCLHCALPACRPGRGCLIWIKERAAVEFPAGFLRAKQRRGLRRGFRQRIEARLRQGPATLEDMARDLDVDLEWVSVRLAYLILDCDAAIIPAGMRDGRVIYTLGAPQ